MQVRVTAYDRSSGGGELVLTSDEPLYVDPTSRADFGSAAYHMAVGRRLTPVGHSAVNHLCRGLQGVHVSLMADNNRILLAPHGPAAASLYDRVCSRLASPRNGELPLDVAMSRDLEQDVSVVLAGSATPQAVPVD